MSADVPYVAYFSDAWMYRK